MVKCENCIFAEKKDSETFECRRNPPQVVILAVPKREMVSMRPQMSMQQQATPVFPYMRGQDWCGEGRTDKLTELQEKHLTAFNESLDRLHTAIQEK